MEEIKSADIMIGSYFYYNHKIVFIAEILKDKLVTIYDGSGMEKGTTLGCLSPIPLTEDILSKVGFDNDMVLPTVNGELQYYGNGRMAVGGYKSCTLSQLFISECKYLHQLQNLFKALTGNDLKIEV